MTRRFSLVFLLIVLLRWAVPHGTFAATPKRGGTLRFGISSDILSLNPFQRALSITKQVGSVAFECLLAVDNKEVIHPNLAASWEISDDGREYTFHLRKGVKFHNGQTMTSEDVKWSMDYAKDPKNGAYGRDKLRSVQSITTPDPATLRIVLKEPYTPFLTSLSSGFDTFPVVPKGSVPPGRARVDKYPPGTGPFMMTEYKRKELIKFKRFDQYWQQGIPYLDGIEFRPIPEATVRFTALRAGDLDMMYKLPYDYAARVRRGEVKNIKVGYSPEAGYWSLIFNLQKKPFDDLRVRQAVAYAIDKAEIIDGITLGFGQVYDQKVPPKSRWHVPLKPRERNLAKARQLMKEAGHGSGIKVTAQISRGWPNPEMMQFIQQQVKEIGIDLQLQIVDFAKNQQLKRSGDFQMDSLGGATYIDPDLAYYQYFHTENTAIKVGNFPRYSNSRVDKLLEEGRKEPNFQKRYQIYKEVIETLHRELPQITIGFIPNPFVFHNYVKDFQQKMTNNDFYWGAGGLGMSWLDR